MNSELSNYVQTMRQQNRSDEEIRTKLLNVGWEETKITEALENAVPIPLPNGTNTQNSDHADVSMWDSFQHILMFISMGVFVISFTLLVHLFIDQWIPDATTSARSTYYAIVSSYKAKMIRGYISSIIVSFPLFTYLFLKIQKETLANPEIKKLKWRKLLTYLTLIIAFIFIIANVISTVFNFLDGNVSLNFVAHISNTLFVSGFVFWYFLKQIKLDKTNE